MACTLQILLIVERVLNRVMMLLFRASQSESRKVTSRNIVVVLFVQIVQIMTVPLEFAGIVLASVLQNAVLWGSLGVAIGILSLVSQSSGGVFVLSVNTYNSGIGAFINGFWVQATVLYSVLFRPLIPIYNAIVWFSGKVLLYIVVPTFQLDLNLLPELTKNTGLFGASLVMSLQTFLSRVVECSQEYSTLKGLDCIGNTNYMTLDLMTPGLYAREIVKNFDSIVEIGCSPALLPLNVLLYPLLDYNCYVFVHSQVNLLLHPISLTLTTFQRCAFAHDPATQTSAQFSELEKSVMCVPDFQPWVAIGTSVGESLGKLADNWLNMGLIMIETALYGTATSCNNANRMGGDWSNAAHILHADTQNKRPIQVVGLTDTLYAFTDGLSTVYDSAMDVGEKAIAVANWPFEVNVNHGIAAVRFGDLFDADRTGDLRTGMLGCTCYDSVGGVQLWCASVPYLISVADNETDYNSSTIHRVRFADEGATRYMTCANTHIKVTSLRFSRKRMSYSRGGGIDTHESEYFDTASRAGERFVSPFAADAAVYVSPRCSTADASRVDCVPGIMTCFPYCMGLHAGAQQGVNITMYPARKWADKITLTQTDCVLGTTLNAECAARDADVDAVSDTVDTFGLAVCKFDGSTCKESDRISSSVPRAILNTSRASNVKPQLSSRRSLQPFVVAGDFMLFEDDALQSVIIMRLYDHREGDFSLRKEALGISESVGQIHVEKSCQLSDHLCYIEALRNNRVIVPPAVRLDLQKGTPSAASKWALHWADNPDDSALALPLGVCQGDATFGAFISTSVARPRVWTLKTTRAGLDETRQVHFMNIPDWLAVNTLCEQEVNLKVTDLEFLNSENILVTVLRGTPRDYDWHTGFVRPGRHYSYTFYFLHPNLHECVSPDDDVNDFYSCWRSEAEGMWPSRESAQTSLYGTLCPALRRMPQFGSAFAALSTASWTVFGIVLDAVTVFPAAAAAGSVPGIFAERIGKSTFHSTLDSCGNNLFNIEPALVALDAYAFHISHSVLKLASFLKGNSAYSAIQPILVGTAKIQQHLDNFAPLEDPFLSVLDNIKTIPTSKGFSAASSGATSTSTSRPSILARMGSLFPAASGLLKYNTRLVRKVLRKIIMSQVSTSLDGANLIRSAIYDLDTDFGTAVLSSQRAQCDGLSNVLGTTNPLARMVRHACYLTSDAMQGATSAGKVLFMDYASVDCACRLGAQGIPDEIVRKHCLQRDLPTQWQASYQHFLVLPNFDSKLALCFAAMDDANSRLEHSFDGFFSRLIRFTSAMEDSLDYLLEIFPLIGEGAGECNNIIQSPYVVSIVPRPIDYFYGCVHTFDCRSRCLDSFVTFENALQEISMPVEFSHDQPVEMESRFFTFEDAENMMHLAPFEVFSLAELHSDFCPTVCNSAHEKDRCLVVAGLDHTSVLSAYYCIPASYKLSVFQYQQHSHFEVPSGWLVDHMFVLGTSFRTPQTDGETLLVLMRESAGCRHQNDEWTGCSAKLSLSFAGHSPVSLLETKAFYPQEPSLSLDTLESIDNAWVRPASSLQFAQVFVDGRKRQASVDGDGYDLVSTCRVYTIPSTVMVWEIRQYPYEECAEDEKAHIFAHTHHLICTNLTSHYCGQVLKLPRAGSTDKTIYSLSVDWNSRTWTEETSWPAASIADMLATESAVALYRTQANRAVHNRRHLSVLARSYDDGQRIDVLSSGTNRDHRGWVFSIRIDLPPTDSPSASYHASTRREEVVNVRIACSIDNCIGCVVKGQSASTAALQTKCFAAAQCGVARCAGSMVNMRKPLCNIAKVSARSIDMYRVAAHSTWIVLVRNIIMIVELTKSRREQYEIDFIDDVFMSSVCNVKDAITEGVATMTSIVGGIGYIQDVLLPESNGQYSQVDSRYHSRTIMITTALTGCLTNVLLLPLYQTIALQKTISCRTNDMFLIVQDSLDTPVKFTIGNRALSEASDAVVGMCLTKQIEATLREYGHASGFKSTEGGLADIMSQATDKIVKSRLEHFKHAMDGSLTYTMGVLGGVVDVVATSDWYHCRPPVSSVDVSECACKDENVQIDATRRTESFADNALWCSGPLLLSNIDGNDILVWNQYSFEELLGVDFDAFLKCVLSGTPDCSHPRSTIQDYFSRQGVSVLQVITQCRRNYLAQSWDAGAFVLGMYDYEVWNDPWRLLQVSLLQNDAHQKVRVRLRQIYSHIKGSRISYSVWQCLHTAFLNHELNHGCMQEYIRFERGMALEKYFMYERTGDASKFASRDACRVFSGLVKETGPVTGAALNPSLQIANALNARTVSNTVLHHVSHTNAEVRVETAKRELVALQNDIEALLQKTTNVYQDQISAVAWSVEGDELHQLVDCVMMGPFAAADMKASFQMNNNQRLPVEQYYRSTPTSRAFEPGTATQGSPARKRVMESIIQHVSSETTAIVTGEANKLLAALKSKFRQRATSDSTLLEAFMCDCSDGTTGLECCIDPLISTISSIRFPALYALDEWDMSQVFVSSMQETSLGADIWNALWTNHTFDSAPMPESVKEEMAFAQLFDPVETVYQYDKTEVKPEHSQPLWFHCVALLSTPFFTLPMKGNDVDADLTFDPTAESSDKYMHAVERVVENILRRAEKESPVFWSHVHRYVASDSAWCEDRELDTSAGNHTSTDATIPSEFYGADIAADTIRNESISNVRMPGTISCACGWAHSNGSCATGHPRLGSLCALSLHDDAVRHKWSALCGRGWYTSRSDYFLMQHVLFATTNASWMSQCDLTDAALHWGLVDVDDMRAWYENNPNVALSMYQLAAHGPSGLRLGMLGNPAQSMRDFLRSQTHLKAESPMHNFHYEHTVAQPVCESGLRESLPQNLTHYFRDVFFPMAHTVESAPATAACSRWVVEHALHQVISRERPLPEDPVTAAQREASNTWHLRCKTQLQQISICVLRGVYDIEPAFAKTASGCQFSVSAEIETECSEKFYVTPQCVVMCNGKFYDPCSCTIEACKDYTFSPRTTDCPPLFDVRQLAKSERVLTDSLHAADSLPIAEVGDYAIAAPDKNWDLRNIDDIDRLVDAILEISRRNDQNEGNAPHAFCDDMFDYWDPAQQHPVGYHPTCSCLRSETRLRGFDSWMSRGEDTAWAVDPVRLRNMTSLSTTHGAAHLTCSADIYGTTGRHLNPYILETRTASRPTADLAVPATGASTVHSDVFFDEILYNVEENADTPLLSDYPDFAFSLGLVRDWFRDDAAPMDSDWPSWDPTRTSHFGLPRSTQDTAANLCPLPELQTCKSSDTCPNDLVCLRNEFFPERDGICSAKDTCFQHSHCDTDMMCSADGACVPPRLVLTNHETTHINAQVFAKERSDECDVETSGFSQYQLVDNFFQDNGLCSHRDWFQYLQNTQNATPNGNLRDTEDHYVSPTDRTPDLLSSAGFLRQSPHACDFSYQHTDFKICNSIPFESQTSGQKLTLDDVKSDDIVVNSTRLRSANVLHFCNFDNTRRAVSGFLNPYVYRHENASEEDTLVHVPDTISTCQDFGVCVVPAFHIDGQEVANNKREQPRQVPNIDFDSSGYPQTIRADTRAFKHSDAKMCNAVAFGVTNKDGVTYCIVDRFTMPLLGVLFTATDQQPHITLELYDRTAEASIIATAWPRLLDHCPSAFGKSSSTFIEYYRALSRPYGPAERDDVVGRANRLILEIFGNSRGFDEVDKYTELAKCASYLLTSMEDQRRRFEPRSPYPASGTNQAQVPGLSLYVFRRHSVVYMPFLWLWQCVLLAEYSQGGAPTDWQERITQPERNDKVTCKNFRKKHQGVSVELAELLKTSNYFFTQRDAAVHDNMDISNEIFEITKQAINALHLPLLANVKCVHLQHNTAGCFTRSLLMLRASTQHCFEKYGRSSDETFTDEEIREGSDLYKKLRAKIYGQRENVIRSFVEHLENGIIERREDTARLVSPNALFVATLFFPNLEDAEETVAEILAHVHPEPDGNLVLVNNNDAVYAKKTDSSCRDQGFDLVSENTDIESSQKSYILTESEYHRRDETPLPPSIDLYKHSFLTNQVGFTEQQALYILARMFRVFMYQSPHFISESLHFVLDPSPQYGVAVAWEDHDFSRALTHARAYDTKLAAQTMPCSEEQNVGGGRETNRLFRETEKCLDQLKTPVGWTLGVTQQKRELSLLPKKGLFTKGMYASFHETPDSVPFLDKLLREYTNPLDVCYFDKSTSVVDRINPWLASDFDFRLGCDTEAVGDWAMGLRRIDVSCVDDGSGGCASTAYLDALRSMPARCVVEDKNLLTKGEFTEKPICLKRPTDDDGVSQSCTQQHGTVGGYRGQKVDDLHQNLLEPLVEFAGVWDGANTLLRRTRPLNVNQIAMLRVHETDIGGHAFQFVVRDGKMQVHRMYLNSNPASTSSPIGSWLRSIEEFWSLQHEIMDKQSFPKAATGTSEWMCPFAWIDAVSNIDTPLSVRIPDKRRNRIRFEHITREAYHVHPATLDLRRVETWVANDIRPVLQQGLFMTPSMICADPNATSCKSAAFLQAAIHELRASGGAPLLVRGRYAQCDLVLDWPHYRMQLMDHTASSPQSPTIDEDTAESCFAVDRVPPFKVVHAKKTSLQTAGQHGPHGACHMGPLLRVEHSAQSSRIQYCGHNASHLTCTTTDGSGRGSTAFAVSPPPNKRRLPRRRLHHCSACENHQQAGFVDSKGTYERLNATKATRQLSVGLPITISTARAVASSLRRKLCGTASNEPCVEYTGLLQRFGTTPATFFEGLLRNGTLDSIALDTADDDAFWNRPWVFCDQSDDALEQPGSCRGSVSKSDWLDPATRQEACKAALQNASHQNAEPVSFCSLAPQLTTLCARIAEWNDRARRIICEANGLEECHDSGFFYSPTSFVPANREFVHETTLSFYHDVAPDTCPVATPQAADQQLYQSCAALPFQALYEIVDAARSILSQILELVFFAVKLLFELLMNFVAVLMQSQDLMARSAYNLRLAFEMFLFSAVQIVQTIADLIFQIVFDYGLGKAVIELIQDICDAITWIYINVIRNYICAILQALAAIIKLIAEILETIPFVDMSNLHELAKTLSDLPFCQDDDPLNCASLDLILSQEILNRPSPPLIVATRCWSTYLTFFGDSASLSCSASDFCSTSAGSSTVIACAECPSVASLATVSKFGCELSTKQCSCSVIQYELSTCHTNADCQSANPTCRLLDSELEPSFGTLPCTLCTSAVLCFLPAGDSAAFCACSMTVIPAATCTDRGASVWPMFESLCYFQPDRSADRDLTYQAHHEDLLFTSCMTVSFSSMFCTSVTSMTSSTPSLFAVASEQVYTSRRRLLDVNAAPPQPLADSTLDPVCLDAAESAVMPRTLQGCRHSQAHSFALVRVAQADLPSCAFCSWSDFSSALYTHPEGFVTFVSRAERWLPLVLVDSHWLRRTRQTWQIFQHDTRSMRAPTALPDWPTRLMKYMNATVVLADAPAVRRLLSVEDEADQMQDSFEAMVSLHRSYAEQFSAAFQYNYPRLQTKETAIWLEDWPPRYTSPTSMSCGVFGRLFEYGLTAADSAAAFYTDTDSPKTPASSLRQSWPKLRSSPTAVVDTPPPDDWLVASIVRWVRLFLDSIGVNTQLLYDAVYTLVLEAQSNFKCDLHAVQTCSQWNVRILNGTLIVSFYFVLFFLVCQAFGLTFFAILLAPLFNWMVLYICYNYSFACIPLVPTCLFDDVSLTVQEMFPPAIILPDSLLKPGCSQPFASGGSLQAYNATCILSCREAPFLFTDWKAGMAWAAVEVGLGERMVDFTRSVPFIDTENLHFLIRLKTQQRQTDSESLVSGNRYCALVTSYKVIPYIALSLVAITSSLASLRIILRLLVSSLLLTGNTFLSIFTD